MSLQFNLISNRCLEMSKSLFPGQVSLDLIFGWPSQTLDMWTSELNQVCILYSKFFYDKNVKLYLK